MFTTSMVTPMASPVKARDDAITIDQRTAYTIFLVQLQPFLAMLLVRGCSFNQLLNNETLSIICKKLNATLDCLATLYSF